MPKVKDGVEIRCSSGVLQSQDDGAVTTFFGQYVAFRDSVRDAPPSNGTEAAAKTDGTQVDGPEDEFFVIAAPVWQ